MQVIPITQLLYAEPKPATIEARKEKHDRILADLNAPIELGALAKVAYEAKSDRYAATFIPSEGKALTLKATNEVAAFLAEHSAAHGYWKGRMEAGTLVDIYLIQIQC
jgi:hypothetical protein